MPVNPDALVYEQIGEDGFERLSAAFYRLRLKGFLIFRFGGPATYIEQRGHPRLRIRHAPFPVNQASRDRWVQLMDAALDEAQLPQESAALLRQFFHNTATFLINRQGPIEGGGAGFAGDSRFPVRES